MFFRDYLISIAETIDAKFQPYNKLGRKMNPADKGEICEIFVKEFLVDSLGDSFKIFRGGKIIDRLGNKSNQLDIVLTAKNSIKLFGDKGIYPIETVRGCLCVTSTLTRDKLIEDCKCLFTIPKKNASFYVHDFIPQSERKHAFENWLWMVPYKVIFAYQGELNVEWMKDIKNLYDSLYDEKIHINLPDLIIVNKVGFFEKSFLDFANSPEKFEYVFTPFDRYPNIGLPFTRILYYLNKNMHIDDILKPEYSPYLE